MIELLPIDNRILEEIKLNPGVNITDIAFKNPDWSFSHFYNRVNFLHSRNVIRIEKYGRSKRLYLNGE